jgi:hypothetical protein
MYVRCHERGHCCLVREGIPHTGIGVSRLVGGWNRETHLHTFALLEDSPAIIPSEELVFRSHHPAGIDLGT